MFSERTRWNLQDNELARALKKQRSSGRPLLDLTRSNPTECGFAYDGEGIRRALTNGDVLRYRPDSRGISVARDAVAAYYNDQHGEAVSAFDIVLTSGTSEAYSFLFRLTCNAGDEVLIPAPGYPLFDFLADLCDVKLVRFPLVYDHGWQIDLGTLAAVVTERTRALIVVHPNNPTGHYVSKQEQSLLAQFCRERALALIVDEVFLDFSIRTEPARSFVACDQSLTFTLSGLSKICGLPQVKLAWIVVNGPEREKREALARLEIIADAYLSVGTPVQLAASELLEMRGRFQQQVIERVQNNLTEMDRHLGRHNVCTRLEYQGGWTCVLRVPALQPDEEIALALVQKCEVLVHPGHFFDFARPGHMVVSLIVPEHEFSEGTERLLSHFTS